MAKRGNKNSKNSGDLESELGRERKVWLYMVDGRNSDDLAVLDQEGFDTWRANLATKAGDLILMYRTAPFSDIAYVLVSRGDARRTKPTREWPFPDAIDLGDGYRLPRVLHIEELRREPTLRDWDFLRFSRGYTKRRADLQEQGVWPALRRMLEARAPDLPRRFGRAWTGRGRRRIVFLSYASPDLRKIQGLYAVLSKNGIDVWLDRNEMKAGQIFDDEIRQTIKSSKAMIICLSESWLKRKYVQQELEWAMELADKENFLFPVMIERCTIPRIIQSRVHVLSLVGNDKYVQVENLARQLRTIVTA